MRIYITIDKTLYLEAFTGPFMWSVTNGLLRRKKPLAHGRTWALDSGGFGELRKTGKYSFTIDEYLQVVKRLKPTLFFNMDWMCEPSVLEKTGLTVAQHQENTIDNQIAIMEKYSGPKFAGVIQGWKIEDYLYHIDRLKEQGLIMKTMGIGSICRRNSGPEIVEILKTIRNELPNTKLHGFGVKISVLKLLGPENYHCLNSIDSAAWGWMNGCWKARGRAKNPYVTEFSKKLKGINRKMMREASINTTATLTQPNTDAWIGYAPHRGCGWCEFR